jgi:hypothetical protein
MMNHPWIKLIAFVLFMYPCLLEVSLERFDMSNTFDVVLFVYPCFLESLDGWNHSVSDAYIGEEHSMRGDPNFYLFAIAVSYGIAFLWSIYKHGFFDVLF